MLKIPFHIEKFRITPEQNRQLGTPFQADYCVFLIPGPINLDLLVIVSSGDKEIRWEHVSVSTRKRAPNWHEMCFIKDLFWDEEDTVIQYHPPKSQYVDIHPNCLHLWRPLELNIPLPPKEAV